VRYRYVGFIQASRAEKNAPLEPAQPRFTEMCTGILYVSGKMDVFGTFFAWPGEFLLFVDRSSSPVVETMLAHDMSWIAVQGQVLSRGSNAVTGYVAIVSPYHLYASMRERVFR
jgi:hypothetical protein